MASIYKRGNIWWIKYHLNGRRIQQSLRTKEARVARAKMRQLEYKLSTKGLVFPSQIPLAQFLEDFCQYLRTIRTRKSYKNDVSCMRTFFGPVCPSLRPGNTCNKAKKLTAENPKITDPLKGRHIRATLLEEITTESISCFISKRVLQDGISPKTANRLREVLQRMFSYAIKEKNYRGSDGSKSNPAADVERRKEPAPNIKFLTAPQISKQLGIIEDTNIRTMVATLIYAGLRREELLWLTPDDIDLENRLIHVRTKDIDGQYWQAKTKRNRVVPMSIGLCETLKYYSPQAKSSWFFPSPKGKRWDPDNFSQKLREINRGHGLEWSCLDFRHTFGSHLAQKGVSLYKIAKLMGNSPEICRKHYAALMPEKMHDVVEFEDTANSAKVNTNDLLKQILQKLGTKDIKDRRVAPKLQGSE